MKEKKEKLKYEPPMVINLTAKDKAHAECVSGGKALGVCSSGAEVSFCTTGGNGPPLP